MNSKKRSETQYSVPTQLIYGKNEQKEWDYSHHVIPPLTSSSTFRLGSAQRGAQGFGELATLPEGRAPIYVYDRMGEPNNLMLQAALATAEGCEDAMTFASGMGAVQAATSFMLEAGDEIISHSVVYGCTYSLFTNYYPRFGLKTTFVNLANPKAFLPYVTDRTRVIYLESPANPTLTMLDLEQICDLVAKINKKRSADRKLLTVIDNTFATPWAQRPASFGVDIIVHSLTKGLSGFGTHMGGAVVLREKKYHEALFLQRKDFGAILAPQTAWHILVYGMSTLDLRLPRQQENALKIARFLEGHPGIDMVRYPGLKSFPQYALAKRMLRDYRGNFAPGFMVYFTLKGRTPENAKRRGAQLMNFIAKHSYTVTLAVSLGQLRTLIEHPGSTTHVAYPAAEQIKVGIDPSGIRLSVGIEDCDDILHDLGAALDSVGAK